VKDKIDLVLLVVSLFCVPIVIFFKGDMLFEGFDTHWLFIWGTYSDRYSTFFSFSDTPHYNFAELTSWSLASLWIGVTIVAYFILRKGNPTTFVRDSTGASPNNIPNFSHAGYVLWNCLDLPDSHVLTSCNIF